MKNLARCKNAPNGCSIMISQLLTTLAFIDAGSRREALVGKYV
jgi:hypothetical protein